jgi:hypothetical protein
LRPEADRPSCISRAYGRRMPASRESSKLCVAAVAC